MLILANDIEVNPGPEPPDPSSSLRNDTTIDTLNSSKSDPLLESNYSFVHLNVQSLIPKLDVLGVELHDYSILSFTETWMKESDITNDLYLPGFQNPFCHCRNDQIGGGVSVFVKNEIYAKHRKDLEIKSVECVWIELSLSGKKFLYGTFYRPPNSPTSLWRDIEY